MLTKKIAILYIYYGEWPWFFNFFLKSCAFNPQVTFIFITDINPPEKYSENVRFINRPISEIAARASYKLGFDVDLNDPYKLCDFKPSYGFLFDDVLLGFDFWGHGDIDLVLGQIESFIDDDVLNEYEVISVRHEYPTGFFMLYKNTSKINTLFKRSKDYRMVFSSSDHFCFDECNFVHTPLMEGVDIKDTNATIESMMHVITKAQKDDDLKAYFDFHVLEGIPRGTVLWDKGTLTYLRNKKEYEVLLFHFIQLKANKYFVVPKWKNIPDTFFMDHLGFFKYSETTIMGFLARLKNILIFGMKKGGVQILMIVNKVLPKNNSIDETFSGNYQCGHVLVDLQNDKGKIVLKRLNTTQKVVSAKLNSVFFKRNLYVDYHSYTLYYLKRNKMILRTKYGQEITYSKVV